MTSPLAELEVKGKAVKAASRRMAYLSTEVKNKALCNIAADLLAKKDEILEANRIDYQAGESPPSALRLLPRTFLRWQPFPTR